MFEPPLTPNAVCVQEAAQIVGCSTAHLNTAIRKGKLPNTTYIQHGLRKYLVISRTDAIRYRNRRNANV